MVQRLHRHNRGEGARPGNNWKGNGNDGARFGIGVALEKLYAQHHFESENKQNDRPSDGKGANIESHHMQKIFAQKEEEQNENSGYSRSPRSTDMSHFVFKRNEHRNRTQNIDNSKQGEGGRKDLREIKIGEVVSIHVTKLLREAFIWCMEWRTWVRNARQ